MSESANTFKSLQSMMHEAYADGVGSHNHKKKKFFKKIKESMKKCKCSNKCGCKK